MAKVVSYTALLYGVDYLEYAIRSVIDAVDEHHILYTPVGSHGSRTSVPCPDTRDELIAIAQAAAGDKLRWHDGAWDYEGQQRDSISQYVPDADVILVVDADEVWSDSLAWRVAYYYRHLSEVNNAATAYHMVHPRRMRIPIVHYWRSFYRCVLHDPAYPERAIYPSESGEVDTFQAIRGIHHFGYAQRSEIVEYKQLTHGHRAQWRQDCDWFHDKFMANAQIDCHPVGSEYWNPEPVDPFALGLPEFMREHPFAKLEVIP